MPQLVESCGMFFYAPFSPFRFLFSDFLEKNMPFYFVLSPICAIFAERSFLLPLLGRSGQLPQAEA